MTTASNDTNAQFNNLQPGVSYSFVVQALTAGGAGPASTPTDPLTIPSQTPTTSQNVGPANPRDVTVTQVGPGQVAVRWAPPVLNVGGEVAGFRVTSVPDSGTQQTAANATSVTVVGLQSNVAYLFLVRTVTVSGALSTGALAPSITLTQAPPASTIVPSTPPANALPLPLPGQVPSPPGTPRPCVSVRWPGYANGVPRNFTTGAGLGMYLWFDGRYWNLRAYNPGPNEVVFTGTVNANAGISASGYFLEKRLDSLTRRSKSLSFRFRNNYDIDAIRISASCATLLSMRFFVNGIPLAANQIFVGSAATNPPVQPVVIIR